MSGYRLALLARIDLKDIWDRIAQRSPRNARRFLQELHSKFRKLADNPFMGSACDHYGEGLRFFVHKSHVIYYRKLDGSIEIARVLHGARDHDAEFDVSSSDS